MLEQIFGPLRGIVLLIMMFGGVYLFNLAMPKSSFLLGFFFILIGLGTLWVAYQINDEARVLDRSAETVTATITDMKIVRARCGYSYRIYLAYTSPVDGTPQTERSTLSKQLYETTEIGDTVELMIATEDPSIVLQTRHYPPSRTPFYGMAFMSVFFVGVGLLSMFLGKD